MTQKELVRSAETEHNQRVPIQAIAKLGPDSECLKFTHCQRVDVANSTSVKMARVCMMNRMRAAPVVVRCQRQNAEEPTQPVIRQTIAKERTMSQSCWIMNNRTRRPEAGIPSKKDNSQ